MRRLDKKTALVTGGASGLGKVIAQRLASEGANVVISDVQTDLGNSIADEYGFGFLEQDVSDELQWNEVIEEVENRFRCLNVLVNNAGILGSLETANPENTRLTEWTRIFAVNAAGVFLGCRAAIPAMRRARGGSIVNVSSVAGLLATPYATAYGASKAVVRHLTKSVAQHCAEQRINVRCNSVHPGVVITPLYQRAADQIARARGISLEQHLEEVRAGIPLREFCRADDVAAAVCFLASDDARHITGAKLMVDGGIVDCDTYDRRAIGDENEH